MATISDGVTTVFAEGHCQITATTTVGLNLSTVCSIDTYVGIEGFMVADAQCGFYNVNRVLLMREATLSEVYLFAPGIYIIRQGKDIKKVVVK